MKRIASAITFAGLATAACGAVTFEAGGWVYLYGGLALVSLGTTLERYRWVGWRERQRIGRGELRKINGRCEGVR